MTINHLKIVMDKTTICFLNSVCQLRPLYLQKNWALLNLSAKKVYSALPFPVQYVSRFPIAFRFSFAFLKGEMDF